MITHFHLLYKYTRMHSVLLFADGLLMTGDCIVVQAEPLELASNVVGDTDASSNQLD